MHRPATAAVVEVDLRRHILPTFGARALASVRPSDVQAWVRGRSAVLAPATVERTYRCLASIFRSAVRDRLLSSSPCVDIRLPRKHPRQVTLLASEQVLALVAALPDRYKALVVLAAGTGLRQGEAFGVTLDEIDWLRRTLAVRHQLSQVGAAPPVLAPPKTASSHRTVPLPNVVLESLAEHLRHFQPGPHQLVFTNSRGEPLRRTRFGDSVWRPARQRAGLPGVCFHDLRHTYASLLIQHGESVKVVQARLGHASASETLDTYAHLWPDSEDRTRVAVDTALRALVADRADQVRTSDQPQRQNRRSGVARGTSRPVSRVLSLRHAEERSGGDGHPSGTGVAAGLVRSTPELGRAALERSGSTASRPRLSTLLRVGFAEPPGSPRALVRSYRTVSPLLPPS